MKGDRAAQEDTELGELDDRTQHVAGQATEPTGDDAGPQHGHGAGPERDHHAPRTQKPGRERGGGGRVDGAGPARQPRREGGAVGCEMNPTAGE